MQALTWLHRWTGGVIGLLLAVLGLSGAILAFKDWWITAPGARDLRPQTMAELERVTAAALADPAARPDYILFASDNFGLHRTSAGDGGAYLDRTGQSVASWDSIWDRPEHWLFDLHHHLFAGDAGEIVTGIAGLIGIGFIVTGSILWWRTRGTFELRLWPRRLSRPAIIRHHRDLGILVSPLLFLTCLTGAMMTLKPVATLVLSPLSSPAEMAAASAPPSGTFGALAPSPNWSAMLATAKSRFPDAEVRLISLPREPGKPITIRMKQPAEWLPNGRTTLWFAPDNGRLIEGRDALALPTGLQWFNMAYPLHAGKTGSLVWTIMIALTGVALTLLGGLATYSFWFRAAAKPIARAPAAPRPSPAPPLPDR